MQVYEFSLRNDSMMCDSRISSEDRTAGLQRLRRLPSGGDSRRGGEQPGRPLPRQVEIERVAAGHCTGEFAFSEFNRVYGAKYDRAVVGAVIALPL
jgi:hypothetical protein